MKVIGENDRFIRRTLTFKPLGLNKIEKIFVVPLKCYGRGTGLKDLCACGLEDLEKTVSVLPNGPDGRSGVVWSTRPTGGSVVQCHRDRFPAIK